MNSKIRKHEHGFTLVELAIVMIIIGLLIGGVLKGQQLIENAKVTATISETQSYQTAMNAFLDTYDGLPGDIAEATNRIPGCGPNFDATGNFCRRGNGNFLIDNQTNHAGNSIHAGNLDGNNYWTSTFPATWSEPAQAWKHMALAGLISGVSANADPTTPFWGETHPASNLRGGYEIYYDPATTIGLQGGKVGHMLRLSNAGLIRQNGNAADLDPYAGEEAVSPRQAAQIDRKIDDGLATGGFFVTNYGGNGGTCRNPDGTYDEATTGDQKVCVPYWIFE